MVPDLPPDEVLPYGQLGQVGTQHADHMDCSAEDFAGLVTPEGIQLVNVVDQRQLVFIRSGMSFGHS